MWATFTEVVGQVPARARLTGRLREHAADLVGHLGVPVSTAAGVCGLSWPSTHQEFVDQVDPVLAAPLRPVRVLGIDETRRGRPRFTRDPDTDTWVVAADRWHTGFVDISGSQGLLGQVEGRTAEEAATVAKMARKYKASIDTDHGVRACFQVTVQRDQGKKPLVARFGGIPLIRKRTAVMTDLKPIMATVKRNELIHRLLAGRCELCEGTAGLQVHHIRKLADLNKPGRPERPSWMHLMAMRKRKTLVVCETCHQNIHTGRVTVTTRK